MNILGVLTIAIICEAVWETCKMFYPNGKISIDRIGSLIVSELLCFGANIDLFGIVGQPLSIPYIGIILSGLLISRGSNFIHDLLSSINNLKENTKDIAHDA
jgi:hypothetical protein